MTMTPAVPRGMPLIQRIRAAKLPPPAERRAIRERAGVSRQEIADELGVSASSVQWWEDPNGFTPRAARAIKYRRLLEQLAELADEQTQK